VSKTIANKSPERRVRKPVGLQGHNHKHECKQKLERIAHISISHSTAISVKVHNCGVCSQIPLLVYEARGLVHFSSGLHLLLRADHFLSAILGQRSVHWSSPVQWYSPVASPVITESGYINSYYKSQHIPLH